MIYLLQSLAEKEFTCKAHDNKSGAIKNHIQELIIGP